jgi:hypothetical protein
VRFCCIEDDAGAACSLDRCGFVRPGTRRSNREINASDCGLQHLRQAEQAIIRARVQLMRADENRQACTLLQEAKN